jgi:hypothetical protein
MKVLGQCQRSAKVRRRLARVNRAMSQAKIATKLTLQQQVEKNAGNLILLMRL